MHRRQWVRSGGPATCGSCDSPRRPERTRSSSARSCTRSTGPIAPTAIRSSCAGGASRSTARSPPTTRRRSAPRSRTTAASASGTCNRVDLSFTEEEQAFADEIRAWLEANLELPPSFASLEEEIEWGRQWQAKLARDRWVGIHWPAEYGGRGASPIQVAIFNMEYARSRAVQLVNRAGINLAGPTLLAHGTDEQKRRWLPSILDASEIWCQLFSEPGAGSDLASLATRAEPVGAGGWLLTGQKVWTSYAAHARWGICLARTDPEAPKHRGISYLVVDMQAPGIEVRPLVQITGEAEFNEVFLHE